ncbi:hypothetical protein WJX73_007999 [Symbiochloris irregularis]|uniref:Uncharacterized protein n=1 Tax=Symbiochloris irregularis TaxID=706552 RepID=A0AAW1NUW2_9CHLO
MFNPQSKTAAAAIFTAGLLLLGYTTYDASQKAILNERPMTAEQQDALRQHIQSLRKTPSKEEGLERQLE